MSTYLVINTTLLFFPNYRFEMPSTKKHITNQVEEWAQRIPLLPSKKQKTTAIGSSHSGSLNVNLNPIMKLLFLPLLPQGPPPSLLSLPLLST